MTSATDVERFVYCAHNWELSRRGVDPGGAGAKRGIREHKRIGGELLTVKASDLFAKDGYQVTLALLGLVVAFSLFAYTVAIFESTRAGIALIGLALVVALLAATLFTLVLLSTRRSLQARIDGNIAPGDVQDIDAEGGGEVLEDEAMGLRGTPDYILKTAQGRVPVEVKTGRTPRHPHESHRMQVATYLHLLQSAGENSPHGLISYPQGTFSVIWDDETRNKFEDLLSRIKSAELTGVAHRDHNDLGKCRGCARREQCGQRLT